MGTSPSSPKAGGDGQEPDDISSLHSDLVATDRHGLLAPALTLEELRLADCAAESRRVLQDIRLATSKDQSEPAIQRLEKLHADVHEVVEEVLRQNKVLRARGQKQARLLKLQQNSIKQWRSLYAS